MSRLFLWLRGQDLFAPAVEIAVANPRLYPVAAIIIPLEFGGYSSFSSADTTVQILQRAYNRKRQLCAAFFFMVAGAGFVCSCC